MKGFTQLSLAALAAYASATAIGDVNKRDSTLKVTLTAAGNTEVKVAVTNNGDKALNLLSKGTFLDEANPVEKVTLYAAGSKQPHFILPLYLRCLFGDPDTATYNFRRQKVYIGPPSTNRTV
jgi:deuterolysin